MGGIAGYIDFHKKTREDTLRKMIEEIHHRGPDCQMHEHLELSEAHIGMGQTDLSIHETNPNGKKPFHYKSLSIILDGEIYNLKEIKALLNDSDDHFASYSDSEIILCAFEKWGVEFIHKLNGIYVIVIFDSKKEKLYIFRDRPGVRPLYYFWKDGIFLFASEIKSLHVHPDFKRDIDVDALSLYFNYGYIPAPHSIFERTYKIESGKYLKMDLKSRNLSNESYWNIEDYYHREKYDIGFDEAKEKVHELMVSSCNYRMEGNVPVGITLSGGYDSTAIAAIIQKNWTEKIKTFTIGFEEGGNEAPFARETARFLGTDHTEYICTTEEAQKIIQELAYYYDEPFADDSAIPTMLVSRLIKTHFDLAVFADGGDHIFAGRVGVLYNNQRLLNHIPGAIKGPIRPILNLLANITPVSLPQMKHKIRSIARSLNQNELVQAGNLFRYSCGFPDFYLKNFFSHTSQRLSTPLDGNTEGFQNECDLVEAFEFNMHLPDCIIAKVEHANSAASLFAREPYLDHRLVELAAQIPSEYKFDGTTGKLILKSIVHDYVPRDLIDRPKTGFTPPINQWLRGDLRYLFDEYLNDKAIEQSGVFNSAYIKKMLELYANGKLYYSTFIWRLLVFQIWFSQWMKK